ncbi:MAG: DNA repair ATPase, partial [Planctomycetota bacterium]
QFDHGLSNMVFDRRVAAPNGEDFLYLFYNPACGTYIQLRYNLIRQTVDTPLVCHGQTLFDAGQMICFKTEDQPQRHHALQIWQTPFTSEDQVTTSDTDSLLFKIGNKELVRGMAECSEVLQLIDKDDNYEGLYVDLRKKTTDILDSYFWVDEEEAESLAGALQKIRDAADAAVDEFEKVVRVRRDTLERSESEEQSTRQLLKQIQRERYETIDAFVQSIANLRCQRGQIIGLRQLRFVDESRVEELEQQITEANDRLSRRCVEFLLSDGSLTPYRHRADSLQQRIDEVSTVAQAKELGQEIDTAAQQLELLTETVSNLKIEDTTKRTKIIDEIGDVFAATNRVRSALKAKSGELAGVEGRAEFASQIRLLQQTVSGYMELCDQPSKCDEYLTKVMVQLEELEGRFAEFDEFVVPLAEQRDAVYASFESRKVQLNEQRGRRAESLGSAADRILKGIRSRAGALKTNEAILAYFASDLMVDKVRDIIDQLDAMDDAVRVGDLRTRLQTVREDAVRQLQDRQQLFEEGGDLIRLGTHRFAVNNQPFDLTTVLRNEAMCLHMTGTQYFQTLDDPRLSNSADLWSQGLVSENEDIYRAEYLAYQLLNLAPDASQINADWVRQQMTGRYEEGYAKGVHDEDAARILHWVIEMRGSLGLLRYRQDVRVAALLMWNGCVPQNQRQRLQQWVGGYHQLTHIYNDAAPEEAFHQTLRRLLQTPECHGCLELFSLVDTDQIADYLFAQLADEHGMQCPVVSAGAVAQYHAFAGRLMRSDRKRLLEDSIDVKVQG